MIPMACVGNYQTQLLSIALWPVCFLILAFACAFGREVVSMRLKSCSRGECLKRHVIYAAMEHTPLLLATFILVPSTATRVFKTFLCDAFEYDNGNALTRRYLHDDLSLSCDSKEYNTLRATAFIMLLLWPVGYLSWDSSCSLVHMVAPPKLTLVCIPAWQCPFAVCSAPVGEPQRHRHRSSHAPQPRDGVAVCRLSHKHVLLGAARDVPQADAYR
jgi:hypothetical protein